MHEGRENANPRVAERTIACVRPKEGYDCDNDGIGFGQGEAVILAHGTGATDYELGEEGDLDGTLVATVYRLIEAREADQAVSLLNAAPFRLFNATNHFNDEFAVLHAEVAIGEYERMRRAHEALRHPAKQILEAFAELGENVRLVVVDPAKQRARWSPSGLECEPDPFAAGGYADVYRARRVAKGDLVAVKRLRRGETEDARARLRREIQEQSKLSHPNVMPILEHDTAFEWFAMPLADGNLSDLLNELDEGDLIEMLTHVALGLEAAHAVGLVHRDVTPRNVLRLNSAEGRRWVVADWGLVRRPRGMTSTMRTEPGQPFGTEGFVAPEVANDGHEADERSDVYSLGRVFGYALLRQVPRPNLMQNVQGRWRQFIQKTTHNDASRRVATMSQLLTLLQDTRVLGTATASTKLPVEQVAELQSLLGQGELAAIDQVVELAAAHPDDDDLWLDAIGLLPQPAIEELVASRADDVDLVIERLLNHLLNGWRGRDYDSLNSRLLRLQWLAQAAAKNEAWGLLEDAARALFEGDVRCQRFKQRQRTRAWLTSLRDAPAECVARALASVPGAVQWYLAEGWRPTNADAHLRAVLR